MSPAIGTHVTEVLPASGSVTRLNPTSARLYVPAGPDKGKSTSVGSRPVVVGADPSCELVLVDRTGQASEAAAKGLAGTVPHEVVALRKGILEWEGDGHPTYNDREEAELDGA